jgi:hypothetical protein
MNYDDFEEDDYHKDQERKNCDFVACSVWFIIFLIFISIMLGCFQCGRAYGGENEMDKLIDAIGIVESNNNDSAIGDSGKAIGRYQIHKAYWVDGCQYLKVDWPYSEATNAKKARQIVRAYLKRYGKGKTIEQLARIHNGGLNGYNKEATIKYWLKIKRELEK